MELIYKCHDCGEAFNEPKIETWVERQDGDPVRYRLLFCPYCGSEDIDEAEECSECGEYHFELFNGICAGCLKDLAYDEQTAWEYGQEYSEKVEVNGLLAYLFPDINEALLKLAKERLNNNDHVQYCTDDLDAFSDFIKRREKK